ncbi:hypothetical protein CRYUN_Cryun15aG0044700 [Craigia yunnanensis]
MFFHEVDEEVWKEILRVNLDGTTWVTKAVLPRMLNMKCGAIVNMWPVNNLRSHDQISSIFWLLHSDVHEARFTAVLEYLSSMVASLEPLHQPENGQKDDVKNFSLIENNSKKGKFHVRFKRRNGQVRVMSEEVHIEQSGINFTSLSFEEQLIKVLCRRSSSFCSYQVISTRSVLI